MELLLDFYGQVLTERQRSAVELYCGEDYSLSEIAQEEGDVYKRQDGGGARDLACRRAQQKRGGTAGGQDGRHPAQKEKEEMSACRYVKRDAALPEDTGTQSARRNAGLFKVRHAKGGLGAS